MSYESEKFRKKPIVIEAMRWMGDNQPEIEQWIESTSPDTVYIFDLDDLHISTLEGMMTADLGDWIICGVQNELYPCKNEIFLATYDPVAS